MEVLQLKGAEGYNNGVITQDNIAQNCYSNSNYKDIVARNLKIEDIEYISLYDYASTENYGKKPYTVARANIKYPNVWADMGEGTYIENRSVQKELVTGTKQSITPLSPLVNFWTYTFNRSGEGLVNPEYYKLLVRPAVEANDNTNYWLSSRSLEAESKTKWHFGLQRIEDKTLTSGRLYSETTAATPTETQNTVNNNGVRPVVIIPKSSCIISNGGDNGETYHIQPRS